MYEISFKLMYSILFAITFHIIASNISITQVKKGKILSLVFITLNTFTIGFSDKSYLSMPINIIILVIINTINTKLKIYSIFLSVFSSIIFAASDAIVGIVVIYILDIDFNKIEKISAQYFLIMVSILIIACVLSRLCRNILNKVKIKNESLIKIDKKSISMVIYLIIVGSTIYIDIFFYRYFIKEINEFIATMNVMFILTNSIVIIVLIYINNASLRKKYMQKIKENEFEQLKIYIQTIESISEDLRKFKHDYRNILQASNGYFEADDYIGLKKFYYQQVIPESEFIFKKDMNLATLKNIKLNSVKGLVSSKMIKAKLKGIHEHIEIIDKINKICVEEIDLCRIIGILLDNSIEAAEKSSEKIMILAIIKESNNVVILISNSFEDSYVPVSKIYEKGFSTKGKDRGLGLNIAKEIINSKYKNISLNTKMHSCMFIQELIINND